jgi:hypothetical protein
MSAEVELVFSSSRRTISWDRTRLSIKTLEMLECLKHWITSGLSYETFLTDKAVQRAMESTEQELA